MYKKEDNMHDIANSCANTGNQIRAEILAKHYINCLASWNKASKEILCKENGGKNDGEN